MTLRKSAANNHKKTVLVTGGGGFLGNAIVRKLLQRGDNVISLSRKNYADLDKMGVHQIQGNLSDKQAVTKACEGVDTVFHVAAKAGVWGDYSLYYQTNYLGTKHIIDACMAQDVKTLVYTSSPSVVFNGQNMEGVNETAPYPAKYHAHYPRTKAMAEREVVEAASNGLRTIILRPHLIWGPGDNHLIPRVIARSKKLKQVGDGKNLVDTIYIDNAADAHILAEQSLEKNPKLSGNIYFISQDKPIALWEMINQILAAGGYPPVKRKISPTMAMIAGAVLEAIYKTANLKGEPMMTRFVANELSTSHWFDISAAKEDLGYVPKVSTEEGLKRLSVWLKEIGLYRN